MKQVCNDFMQLATKEAWRYQLLTYPNPAVGACIVKNNKILSIGVHKKSGDIHAEVDAIKKAYLQSYPDSSLRYLYTALEIHIHLIKYHNNFFENCNIFITLEPCNHIGKTPSCANLIKELKLKKVVIGVLDDNKIASGGYKKLKENQIKTDINICKKDASGLIFPFKKWQKNNFVFFKIAMREDGSIDNGYITTKDSLNLVHNIRTKIDLLVIGGQTVRTDRPTLDSRFASQNKNPNILIYSKQKDFDKTIPLFNVSNRDIAISDNLKILDDYNFVMIEGGYRLLKSVKNKIDMLMLFVSHKKKYRNKFDYKTLGFKKLYSYYLNQFDEIIYLKI